MDKEGVNLFLNEGYSCSQAVVMAAFKKGYIQENLVNIATGFSGGISSGCLCGAVSGAIIVIGAIFGKDKPDYTRQYAKQFMDEFKAVHKATCCRVLTSKFDDFHSKERKAHCANMVESSCKILEKIIKLAKEKEESK